ncbi:MAG: ATP-binding protein, partial [Thermocrispum sp.]
TELKDRKGIRWQPPTDVPATKGRADSGDLELDLIELFTDVAELARDLGVGVALFVDEMQDVETDQLAALCGACHEISQQGAPLVVVGAGLPHLPVALSASKSYAERLFRYVEVDRLPREAADRALMVPAASEDTEYAGEALDELYRITDGYPYFVQAYGKVTWDAATGSPIRIDDVHHAAPEAEAELAVGFFGARYERATPAERDYMRAMADLGAGSRDGPVLTADVAGELRRRPQSLSPARDGLIKKGLVFAAERGAVAFTVPHFGKYLRAQRA